MRERRQRGHPGVMRGWKSFTPEEGRRFDGLVAEKVPAVLSVISLEVQIKTPEDLDRLSGDLDLITRDLSGPTLGMGPPALFVASTLVIHHLVEALAAACGDDLETTWRREAAVIMESLAQLPGDDQDPGRD
ncbi:hypothetical protein [Herbidospora sp. NBRC 101105]|uniref:hypothetical protein n=1 Tax=Herbidospora sp. NBRC 101105 TaxID=3032195 RepID=UPI0024A18186|nr:hypothetical protein [Herbidospora sp. NBRC 101105]GLX93012.1 hypothetical protein Hesp01_09620 [Herbidospora sp. NBRC 101105]